MVHDIRQSWLKAKHFVLHDVWDIDLSSMSPGQSFPIRVVRVAQLVFKGYQEDDLSVHASALTFVTLMSLVPMLAVAFALLKGFGFGQEKIDALMTWGEAMPSEFQAFVDQVMGIVNTTNFAALGWVGLGLVVFTAVMVLGSVEVSFNRIWGVTTPRSLFRKTANYISVLVLVPFLIGIGGTIETTLYGAVHFVPDSIGALLRSSMRLTSLFTTWTAFVFLYMFLPNTRVRPMPGLLSGFLAAVVWLLWQKAFITLQMGVARYNAIYGTFASVPIFLAWLYTGWVIVLLGAELTFAFQNASTFRMESAAQNASTRSRFALTLSIIRSAAQSLATGKPPFSTGLFAREHRVPIRLLNDLVRMLVSSGYLAETAGAGKENCFVLLKAPETVKVIDLFEIVAEEGARPESLGLKDLDASIVDILDRVEKGLSTSLGDLSVRDLLGSP